MNWDISTEEKALFGKAPDGEDRSWKRPMLDESEKSLDTEMPDMTAEPPTLEGRTIHPCLIKRRSMRTKIL